MVDAFMMSSSDRNVNVRLKGLYVGAAPITLHRLLLANDSFSCNQDVLIEPEDDSEPLVSEFRGGVDSKCNNKLSMMLIMIL